MIDDDRRLNGGLLLHDDRRRDLLLGRRQRLELGLCAPSNRDLCATNARYLRVSAEPASGWTVRSLLRRSHCGHAHHETKCGD